MNELDFAGMEKMLERKTAEKKIAEEFEKFSQAQTRSMFHHASSQHSAKLRGIGVTRKDKSSTKKADKLSRKQRQKNRKIASKKSRPTGSKQRK
jgi:hypothetical protein